MNMMVFYVRDYALYSSKVPRLLACILHFVRHAQFSFSVYKFILVMYI